MNSNKIFEEENRVYRSRDFGENRVPTADGVKKHTHTHTNHDSIVLTRVRPKLNEIVLIVSQTKPFLSLDVLEKIRVIFRFR